MEHPPLNISIVGAGLAGLAAAVALRRSGHQVQIFESTQELSEIGAAIVLPQNCLRVLEHLGYDRENLNSVNWDEMISFDALSGEGRATPWLSSSVTIMCLRSEFHDELKRLALGPGDGIPAVLHLNSKALTCDADAGFLELTDGRRIQADVILGADGIASTIRTHILGNAQKSVSNGRSVYRALIPTSTFDGIPQLAWLRDGASGPRLVLKRGVPLRSLFMYPCRGGAFLNLTAHIDDPDHDDPDWRAEGTRAEVQAMFAEFHPQFQPLLAALPERLPRWQMRMMPVLPTWVRGRAALLGDAAHATLPTLGQGAAMAMEDAGALGALLPTGTKREDISARLAAYEALRKERAEFVGRESFEQVRVPTKFGEYYGSKDMQEFLMDYDAVLAAREYFKQRFGARC
ncbi:FAD/NAD(P)-binding domain-containing protein [Mycena vulgaris]|nr:FAD/NAD(P)-binding domain-containing protein [Mycena vulgaris]KAJ6514041.1 FAD/NAD(P)-binding domain-containing protein [Mycena vulgaris]